MFAEFVSWIRLTLSNSSQLSAPWSTRPGHDLPKLKAGSVVLTWWGRLLPDCTVSRQAPRSRLRGSRVNCHRALLENAQIQEEMTASPTTSTCVRAVSRTRSGSEPRPVAATNTLRSSTPRGETVLPALTTANVDRSIAGGEKVGQAMKDVAHKAPFPRGRVTCRPQNSP